jgi:hypothetical protein
MGKRVSGKRAKMPVLQLGKLRHGGETQFVFYFFVPFAVIIFLVGFSMMFHKGKGADISNMMLKYGIGWIVIGWVFTLLAANAQKSKMMKRYPRSKVMGSSYTDIRQQLNTQCRLLGIAKVPDTFIIDSPQLLASVRGVGAPYLVITNKLLEWLSERERAALFAVLLGNVRAHTVRWRTIISTLKEINPLLKLICLPYAVGANFASGYLEASFLTSDRIALLLLGGDYHLLTTALIKVMSLTSESITPEQAKQLEAFLGQQGMQARSEDVERAYILNQMVREIPGLRDRIENITTTPADPKFQEQLAIMQLRIEQSQPVGVVR